MASIVDIVTRLHPEVRVPLAAFLEQKAYEKWLVERGKRYGMIGKRRKHG